MSGQLHAPAALPSGKEPRSPLDMRLSGPRNRCITSLAFSRSVHTNDDTANLTTFPGDKRSWLVNTGQTGLQGNTAVSRKGGEWIYRTSFRGLSITASQDRVQTKESITLIFYPSNTSLSSSLLKYYKKGSHHAVTEEASSRTILQVSNT
jgi:hypothetical protein